MNIQDLTMFFGWMSVINIGLLLLTILFVITFQDFALNLHEKMFHLKRDKLKKMHFKFIALYKIQIIVFSIVPYLALKLMS